MLKELKEDMEKIKKTQYEQSISEKMENIKRNQIEILDLNN